MKYSELRASIRAWFETKVRVDAWTLALPTATLKTIDGVQYPANIGIEAPIKNVYTNIDETVGFGQKVLHVVMPYAVQYRFSHTLPVASLPQTALTSLYTNVLTAWLVNGAALDDDILRVGTTDIVESPITIGQTEEVSGDWIVTLFFEFEIECLFEPEKVGSIQPDNYGEDPILETIPTSVSFGVWRSKQGGLGDPEHSYNDSED